MFSHITLFELRYQLRNPVFWVVAVLFFLLTFGAMTVDNIQIGSGGNVKANSPVAIAQTHLILTIFFMFVTTAFVANVVVRDDESGFGPLVRATRVSKFDYLLGRFSGAFAAALLAFAVVPLAIWLGTLMPWLDAETLGPNRIGDYAYAYLVFAVPGIFLTSCMFFAVATLTRSMLYSYLGVLVFLILYTVFNAVVGDKPEWREAAAYIEPFGLGAFFNETRYWTATESNQMMPAFSGIILANRLIWFAVALAVLAFAYWRFSFSERSTSKRKSSRQANKQARLAAVQPQLTDTLPAPDPRHATWARLLARSRLEMVQVFRSPAFLVLLLVGLFNSSSALLYANELYSTPAWPVTFSLILPLLGSFSIFPVIIAIYYAGELVWRDRDLKMHEIIDATPLPNWAYMLPKTLAVTGVMFATLLGSVLAAVIIQLLRGYTDFEFDKYLNWYIVPQTVDLLLLAILAVFVQALSPNKYVGWAIMVVYLVATLTLNTMGFEHPLYQYGDTGFPQLSDINGNNVNAAAGWWLRLYWSAVATVLALLAHLLWRRGTDIRLTAGLRRLPARLQSPSGAFLAVALLVAVGSGSFIYYNMNVLNEYRTSDDGEKLLADYEKKYLRYEKLKQPSVTNMTLKVDIYPQQQRLLASGEYRFVNDTGGPLEELHIRFPDRDIDILDVNVSTATLQHNDEKMKYRIYKFDTPVKVGATGSLSFKSRRRQQGFRAGGNDTRLVRNGTFLNNSEFAPQIGMNRDGLLSDRRKRRKYDLPAELRPAKLEQTAARTRNYLGDADWVQADITVSTSSEQTPLAPGKKVADEVEGGRRTARFVAQAPILAFFSIQSADYTLAQRETDGVDLSVYYHQPHDFNVERMLNAMQVSLSYYKKNFGPYQFDYARIVEFPGYSSFAQAFAGTMPYSESLGFIANTSDPQKIDYVTYVTAHEVAHQYWAHQLISADMQGGTLMVETLAQYSALMVMKQLYGGDNIRRFLKYELDSYLSARGSEVIEELPLNRVENQGYIHYRKGAVVMYLLQDRLGEQRVNTMLAALLDKYRFKSQPYAISTDLVDGFKTLARNKAERLLVSDVLERITIYDLKARSAKVRQLNNGSFETVVTVAAEKYYADGEGKERQTRLDDDIDIGLFMARPGLGAFKKADVVFMQRRPITSGTQQIRIVSNKRPLYVGVDPYNKYIDRNSDDNVSEITGT